MVATMMMMAIRVDLIMTTTVAVRTTARMTMTMMKMTMPGTIFTVALVTLILKGAAVARPSRGKAHQT